MKTIEVYEVTENADNIEGRGRQTSNPRSMK